MGPKRQSSELSVNEVKLVKVSTSELKSRLNRLYRGMRSWDAKRESGRFDYLWDLKELALMEGRPTVDVPDSWLDELEQGFCGQASQHGH